MNTNLTDEIEYINHPKVQQVLTDKMKKKLIQRVQLPRDICKEIDQEIQENKNKFICKICSNSFDQKYHAQCHTKIEMGYYDYRCSFCNYRSGTVNSKFHLIRSYCEIFFYNFPNISCLKYTVNSNFHLIRSKTWPTNDFELILSDLYLSNTTVYLSSLCN